ncbi:ATP-binding cassette domain-containing protein [Lentilactobacillus farraginis]|uniref:ABC transporter, ATP-binding protein n=1 Tax=Lentilactobacillus farraginis DSM 18382 = JCM 14108 TaxID=1423743 RepID=X0QFZ0_9LACO|nr:ATP-binding cassette domain-containing protein [Lentilactobacillus farraginis]GAF37515.1 ABC transporter, ATP-binding protein [Lentilactobacillus farraginis DSM 18382 = JCM 14108]
MTVQLINVSKKGRGTQVLTDISYNFENGRIYGLFGAKNSGMGQLIRIIAGLVSPTSGKIIVNAEQLHEKRDFPKSIGVLLENTTFPNDLTGLQNMVLLNKIRRSASVDDIKEAFQKMGMTEQDWQTQTADYFPYMLHKLGLVQAIFEKPQLILLEEPAEKLNNDDLWRLKKVLVGLASTGSTVILSCHDEEKANLLSDTVLQMAHGKLIGQASSNWLWQGLDLFDRSK